MKKLNTIIFGIILIVICICVYSYQFDTFSKNFALMEEKKENWIFGYYALPERYLDDYGSLPKDIGQIKELIGRICEEDNLDTITRFFLEDNLSNNGSFISYYPIYQRETKSITSCIYLSAGIDGKMDNILSLSDTLYIDNWHLKLKTYNMEDILATQEIEGKINIMQYPSSKYFSIWDRVFGDKDYILILYKPFDQ